MTEPTRSNRPRSNALGRAVRGAALVLLLAASGVPAAAVEAQEAAMPDVQSLGPQVGTRVPDFTLADQRGRPRTLASLMGPKGLMLVFVRSADW